LPRWRSPIRIRLLLAIAAIVVMVVVYIFGVSAIQAWGSPLFQASDLYVPRLIDVVLVAWCFWIGSSVGSFLNVVAWRMPRGESINGRSYCPRCQAQLRARDNFPVFGWLALGGRCRTCRLPISVRYPIVEGVVGTTITLVAICELYRLSLPYQQVHWHGGPFWAPVVDRSLLMTLLYHVFALATAWAMGLIRMDGQRLPTRLLVFAVVVVTAPMIAVPEVMVVPWHLLNLSGPDSMQISRWNLGWVHVSSLHLHALIRLITSIVAAIFIARVLARGLCPHADPKLDPLGKSTVRLIDLIAILAVPIIVVGWQASAALVVLASLIAYSLQVWLPACDALGRLAVAMPVALTVQIIFWRAPLPFWFLPRDARAAWFWPSEISPPGVILFWAGLLLLIPLWLKETRPPHRAPTDDGDTSHPESASEAVNSADPPALGTEAE
jgi:leader peptidase (prepilin peptidase) / N-methyltransferase